jgi:hypothetical protein
MATRGDAVLAHGLGGGADLPIPANLAIAGGTAALTLSFVVLLMAWRRPRFGNEEHQARLPPRLAAVLDSRALAAGLRVLGMLCFAFTAWAAIAGPDSLVNPSFGIVYVWLWVGLVPASLLLGPVFRAVSPARTIHLLLSRAVGSPPEQGLRDYPARWGYWPASIALFAFVWMELVYPGATNLGPLRLWFALYLTVVVVGGLVYGDRWIARTDPFEVYSTLLAHLSPWGRSTRGQLVAVNPLRNLATLRPEPGLVGVVSVLLGSTAWDSFRESATWVRYVQSSEVNVTVLNTGMLVAAVLLVGVVFTVATRWTGGEPLVPRREMPWRLAHSIVPIIVGYMVAHYLTFLVEVGQQTLIQVSDPMGTGADLFGTADLQISYWLSRNPEALASIKVLAIVTGHVLGVVAAHDRALQLLPSRQQVVGQLPLLAAMTLYTFGGLYLLFGA